MTKRTAFAVLFCKTGKKKVCDEINLMYFHDRCVREKETDFRKKPCISKECPLTEDTTGRKMEENDENSELMDNVTEKIILAIAEENT